MAEFNFSLSTRQREFAEKMHMRANAILAELLEPKDKKMELFELFETEDFRWGIGCVCHDSSAKAHEQALKQVVGEFPEIKMTYQESQTESGYFYEAVSRNGQLVKVEPWGVAVNTADKDDFAKVVAYLTDNIKEAIWVNEDGQWAKWHYDHLTEEDQVSECLQRLGNHFPPMTIRCVKFDVNDFADGDVIDSYAEVCGDKVEWKAPESFITQNDIDRLGNSIVNTWRCSLPAEKKKNL